MAPLRPQCAGHLPLERQAVANGSFSILPSGTTDPLQTARNSRRATALTRLMPFVYSRPVKAVSGTRDSGGATRRDVDGKRPKMDEQDEQHCKARAKIGNDPHHSFANMLCDVAWVRSHGNRFMILPDRPAAAQEGPQQPGAKLPDAVVAGMEELAVEGTCGCCESFNEGAVSSAVSRRERQRQPACSTSRPARRRLRLSTAMTRSCRWVIISSLSALGLSHMTAPLVPVSASHVQDAQDASEKNIQSPADRDRREERSADRQGKGPFAGEGRWTASLSGFKTSPDALACKAP